MKSLTFIGLGTTLLFAACSQRPSDAFTLTGNITGADSVTIYLTYAAGDSTVLDSAVIADGTFKFAGNVSKPTLAVLYTGDLRNIRNRTAEQIYLEPGDMTIDNLTADNFSDMKVTGSLTQAEKDSVMTIAKALYEEASAMRIAMSNPGITPDSVRLISEKMDIIRDSVKNVQLNFIKTHPASYYSGDCLKMITSSLSYEDLRSIYDGLTPEIQATVPEVASELVALEAIQPGNVAPDVVGVNQNGDSIKMSDLRGKVVLLDFWATWCVPCRQSFPHVKEVYNKYHDKGLEVFCVADDDSNPDGWKAVIVSDGLENYHHVLRGLKTLKNGDKFVGFDRSNDQSDKYAVHYIPSKFLIAADGTMIGRFDDPKELDAKLAEIFNN